MQFFEEKRNNKYEYMFSTVCFMLVAVFAGGPAFLSLLYLDNGFFYYLYCFVILVFLFKTTKWMITSKRRWNKSKKELSFWQNVQSLAENKNILQEVEDDNASELPKVWQKLKDIEREQGKFEDVVKSLAKEKRDLIWQTESQWLS